MATLAVLLRFASSGAPGVLGPLGSITGALGAAGVAGAAALAAGALANMTQMAAEEQEGINRLAASLTAAGSSYKDNEAAIEALVNERERLAFSDDVLRESLSRLVQSSGDLTKAQELQALAMDLSRAKGMDLVAASELVGKVSQGNVSTLSRYGIVLQEGATASEALAEMQKRFAGQAAAHAESATAGWVTFGQELANVQENIGSRLLPAMDQAGNEATEFLQQMQDLGIDTGIGDVVAGTFHGILEPIRDATAMLQLFRDEVVETGEIVSLVMAGDIAGALERSKELWRDNAEAVSRINADSADLIGAATSEASTYVGLLADDGERDFSRFGDAAEEAAVAVDISADDMVDSIARLSGTVEGSQDVYDAWAEHVGESLQAANDAAVEAAQTRIDVRERERDALQQIVDDENDAAVKAAQTRIDVRDAERDALQDVIDDAAKVQEKADREAERAADEHVSNLRSVWNTLPSAVQDSITVLDDFTLNLETVGPQWRGQIEAFAAEVNALPEASRSALLGGDLFVWKEWAEGVEEQIKTTEAVSKEAAKVSAEANKAAGVEIAAAAVETANVQIAAANAAAAANVKAAANALAAWSGGTPGGNAGLMQGGGGFGPGGTQYTGGDAFYWDPNIGGWRGKAPSQGGHYVPRRGDPPPPKWLANEWERSVSPAMNFYAPVTIQPQDMNSAADQLSQQMLRRR